MIRIKRFCNFNQETASFRKGTKAEIISSQHGKVEISAKNKSDQLIQAWESESLFTNFRYRAWYNGNKPEFLAAKKLASLANTIYNASGQDVYISGVYDVVEIKKLITQFSEYAGYWDKFTHRD